MSRRRRPRSDRERFRAAPRHTAVEGEYSRLLRQIVLEAVKAEVRGRVTFADARSPESHIAARLKTWAKRVEEDSARTWAEVFDRPIKAIRPDIDVDGWVSDNADLITRLTKRARARVKKTLQVGTASGLSTRDLAKRVQADLGVSQRRATLIAVDQTLKLNSDITRESFKRAGLRKAKWLSSSDERVRESHQAVHGKVFDIAKGLSVDGVRTWPGRPYRCRCTMYPVDAELDDLPDFEEEEPEEEEAPVAPDEEAEFERRREIEEQLQLEEDREREEAKRRKEERRRVREQLEEAKREAKRLEKKRLRLQKEAEEAARLRQTELEEREEKRRKKLAKLEAQEKRERREAKEAERRQREAETEAERARREAEEASQAEREHLRQEAERARLEAERLRREAERERREAEEAERARREAEREREAKRVEEARRTAEREAKRLEKLRAAEEARKRAEEELARKREELARKREEEERRRVEAARLAEEARKRAEEEARKVVESSVDHDELVRPTKLPTTEVERKKREAEVRAYRRTNPVGLSATHHERLARGRGYADAATSIGHGTAMAERANLTLIADLDHGKLPEAVDQHLKAADPTGPKLVRAYDALKAVHRRYPGAATIADLERLAPKSDITTRLLIQRVKVAETLAEHHRAVSGRASPWGRQPALLADASDTEFHAAVSDAQRFFETMGPGLSRNAVVAVRGKELAGAGARAFSIDIGIGAGSHENVASAVYLPKSPDPGHQRYSIALHEMAHSLESSDNSAVRRAKDFLATRTRGEAEVPLTVASPGKGYGANEMCRPDKFVDPYIGKSYAHATEVTSMGAERLAWPSFLRDDPDHYAFVLGQLAAAPGNPTTTGIVRDLTTEAGWDLLRFGP